MTIALTFTEIPNLNFHNKKKKMNECSASSGFLLLQISYFSHGDCSSSWNKVGQIKMSKGVGRKKAKGSLN